MKKKAGTIFAFWHRDKEIDYEKIVLYLLCLAFSVSFYVNTVPIENTNYGLEQLHQYDGALFQNNIMLQEEGLSARFFSNLTVSVLMHVFHMSWANVTIFLNRLNFVLYAVMAARTACKLTKHRLLFGMILLSCVFRSSLGVLAGFGLNGAMYTFIGSGTVLVLFAISNIIGEKKHWLAAWILLGAASLMHVHEGMWGGLIVGVLWVAFCIAEKKIDWNAIKGLPIYVVIMLVITVPTLLQGESVDNARFVEVYAHYRTPNHLLPTVWGTEYIIKCLLLILIPTVLLTVLFVKNKTNMQIKKMLLASVLTVMVWCGILGLEYYATLIHPSASLVTMYMPKCFKYAAYIAMLLYLKLADYFYEEKKYLQAACALMLVFLGIDYNFVVIMVFTAVLLFDIIFEVENKIFEKTAPFYHETIKLLSWALLLWTFCRQHGWAKLQVFIAVVLFVIEFALPFVRIKTAGYVLACLAALSLLTKTAAGMCFIYNESGIYYISGEDCLKNAVGYDLYELAEILKEEAGPDEVFLANPEEPTAGWVQLLAERNCYAILKCTPASKQAVMEWYDRIKQVEGMTEMNDEELAELMENIELNYVMIYPEQYEALEDSVLFSELAKTETAAIYKLNVTD